MTDNRVEKYGSKEVTLAAGEKISISNYGGGVAKIYLFKTFANYKDHYVLEQTLENDITILGPYTASQKILIDADNSTVIYSAGTAPSYNYSSALGPMAGLRNVIINGNFGRWQRGDSFVDTTTAIYTSDRWLANTSGATVTYSKEDFTIGQTDVPGEPESFLRCDATVGDNNWGIVQRVEGVRTLAGQLCTLSFYAKAAAALDMRILLRQHFGSGGSSDVDQQNDNFSFSTDWVRYTITQTLPSISGKTIGTDDSLQVFIIVKSNSAGTIDIANVQLEPGPVATDFEKLPKALTKQLCHCYYWRGKAIGNGNGYLYGAAGNTNMVAAYASFPAYMRKSPDVAIIANPTYTNCSASNIIASPAGFQERVTVTADGIFRASNGTYEADAEL